MKTSNDLLQLRTELDRLSREIANAYAETKFSGGRIQRVVSEWRSLAKPTELSTAIKDAQAACHTYLSKSPSSYTPDQYKNFQTIEERLKTFHQVSQQLIQTMQQVKEKEAKMPFQPPIGAYSTPITVASPSQTPSSDHLNSPLTKDELSTISKVIQNDMKTLGRQSSRMDKVIHWKTLSSNPRELADAVTAAREVCEQAQRKTPKEKQIFGRIARCLELFDNVIWGTNLGCQNMRPGDRALLYPSLHSSSVTSPAPILKESKNTIPNVTTTTSSFRSSSPSTSGSSFFQSYDQWLTPAKQLIQEAKQQLNPLTQKYNEFWDKNKEITVESTQELRTISEQIKQKVVDSQSLLVKASKTQEAADLSKECEGILAHVKPISYLLETTAQSSNSSTR